MTRKGDWICTASGVEFWPLDPRPDEVRIEDIAHALANVCRYGGHSKWHYSVAQHSVLVCRYVIDKRLPDGGTAAKMALLHDAAEAYIGDMVRPLKRLLPEYQKAELLIMDAILTHFGLPHDEPKIVKEADNVLLATEARVLMPAESTLKWMNHGIASKTIKIKAMSPKEARQEFLWEYHHLFGIKG